MDHFQVYNPFNAQQFLMKFAIFKLSASVDIRPLSGVWVAELLVVHVRQKVKVPMSTILDIKGYNLVFSSYLKLSTDHFESFFLYFGECISFYFYKHFSFMYYHFCIYKIWCSYIKIYFLFYY